MYPKLDKQTGNIVEIVERTEHEIYCLKRKDVPFYRKIIGKKGSKREGNLILYSELTEDKTSGGEVVFEITSGENETTYEVQKTFPLLVRRREDLIRIPVGLGRLIWGLILHKLIQFLSPFTLSEPPPPPHLFLIERYENSQAHKKLAKRLEKGKALLAEYPEIKKFMLETGLRVRGTRIQDEITELHDLEMTRDEIYNISLFLNK